MTRDYTIWATDGPDVWLLVRNPPGPDSDARLLMPGGLLPVKPVGVYEKFCGYLQPYQGAQNVLEGRVGKRVFT